MRRQPILIDEDREPSYLNRHLLTGAKVGLIATLGVAATLAVTTGGIGGIALPVMTGFAGLMVGASSGLGCIRGKEYIAKNKEEGKLVNPPSILNEGLAQGVLNAAVITLGVVTAAALIPGAAGWMIGLAGAAAAAGSGYLAYRQGDRYLDVMEAEYLQAERKAKSRDEGILQKLMNSVGKGKSKEATVTPEETAKLNARLKEGSVQKNWLESVTKREPASPELSV